MKPIITKYSKRFCRFLPVLIFGSAWISLLFAMKFYEDPAYSGNSSANMSAEEIKKFIDSRLNRTNGAWLLRPGDPQAGHIFDPKLCRTLEDIFENKTVLDLGAGLGSYGRCFLRRVEPMFPDVPEADAKFYRSFNNSDLNEWWLATPQRVRSWTGYDGSSNIERVTRGFVKYMDLAVHHDLGRRFDWVMAIEVGEHIPAQHTATFVGNLVRHVGRGRGRGIVLSWAPPGQGGWGHVNNLPNERVVEMLRREHGFEPDRALWDLLRLNVLWEHFTKNLMAFRRKE